MNGYMTDPKHITPPDLFIHVFISLMIIPVPMKNGSVYSLNLTTFVLASPAIIDCKRDLEQKLADGISDMSRTVCDAPQPAVNSPGAEVAIAHDRQLTLPQTHIPAYTETSSRKHANTRT